MILEIAIVFALILLNGFFAMSELALVSARKARLKQLAKTHEGARTALELQADPSHFLSTVQVGITMIGVLTGAFGGAQLAEPVGRGLMALGLPSGTAGTAAFALVVITITFLSIVVGELIPKRIAMAHPEAIAARAAGPMQAFARIMAPFARVLGWITRQVLALLGIREDGQSVTEDEIRMTVQEGAEAGAILGAERDMVNRIFRFGDKLVDDLMTPRPQMVTLDADAPAAEQLEAMAEAGYSRYPVVRGDTHEVIGIVRAKDLLRDLAATGKIDVAARMRPPLFVPETTRAIDMLEQMRASDRHMALVIDEYGATQGLVTLTDVLEAIVGELVPMAQPEQRSIIPRADGSFLLDALLPIDELKELLKVGELPGEADQDFNTVAGFMLAALERIPSEGDIFEWQGHKLEVVDMDGRRIDKVLLTLPPPEPETVE